MNEADDSGVTKSGGAFLPGERVHIDVIQVGRSLYHYLAVDDCSRFMVTRLFSNTTVANAPIFLHDLFASTTFAVRGIETTCGGDLFGVEFQRELWTRGIRFQVDQQQTVEPKIEEAFLSLIREFHRVYGQRCADLPLALKGWQCFYNYARPHPALAGKIPIEVVCALDAAGNGNIVIDSQINEDGARSPPVKTAADGPLLKENVFSLRQ